jgi:hypothetical protein
MKGRDPRKVLMKKGESVVVLFGTTEVRAVVGRDESAGRPLVLRTEAGRMMTAFSGSVARVDR